MAGSGPPDFRAVRGPHPHELSGATRSFRISTKAGSVALSRFTTTRKSIFDAYLGAVGKEIGKDTPLWRSMTKERGFGDGRMSRIDVYPMIKRRCQKAGMGTAANCHTLRATGITAYLLNGGSLANAQAIAVHEIPRFTKLYDRTSDEITLDEIERIVI